MSEAPITELDTRPPPAEVNPADDENRVFAYEIHDPTGMTLHCAPIEREWMNNANQRFPYRCLPLVIANQAGWVVTCPINFRVYWYGGDSPHDVEVRFDGPPDPRISGHFGLGTLTFSLPFIFRTPPGVNLWVKGPTNWIKDGIQPLEGVVETDWSSATFTMNWKITRPSTWVEFKQGEPCCMLVPVPRGFAESLRPIQTPLSNNPELMENYRRWEAGRSQFLSGLSSNDPETVKQGWQKEYFQGRKPEGGKFESHQTNLKLREFERE